MIVDEDNEQKENQLLNNNCDIEIYIEDIYSKHKSIYKIILLCVCLIIIIIPHPKKNFNQSINPLPIPTLKPESKQNPEKEPEQEPEQKSDIISEKEPEQKSDNISENEPVQKSDNIPEKEPEQKSEPKIIQNDTIVNLYIIAHKDFKNNIMVNPNYKILCDDGSQLKDNYPLEIISTNTSDNILFPKRIGYGEGSKMYYIWNLYKSGNITSKYVGFVHYKRIFNFKNDIPDLDTIFEKYDGIVMEHYYFKENNYEQYTRNHLGIFFDEAINILKEKFPEYVPYLDEYFKRNTQNYCNIFIMKKNDFIKWGEFVYGILLELDRRFNLTSDEDTRELVEKETDKIKGNLKPYDYKKKLDINLQSRMQGFVMERMTNLFYDRFFKNRLEIPIVTILAK